MRAYRIRTNLRIFSIVYMPNTVLVYAYGIHFNLRTIFIKSTCSIDGTANAICM